MKVLIAVLISVFSFSGLEMPHGSVAKPAVKSCCCKSSVCHCKHGKGVQCGVKKPSAHAGHNHVSSQADRTVRLFPSNCGLGGEKGAAPVFGKEFYHEPPRAAEKLAHSVPLTLTSLAFSSLLDKSLDKPPQNAPFFF